VASFLDELPARWSECERRATLVESFDLNEPHATLLGVAMWSPATREWPNVVVTQRFSPGPVSGFVPGILLVPETNKAFLGAGTRLLGYDLTQAQRLWEDQADCGFWGWRRHGDFVVMSAELELAAWSIHGVKQWSTFVEPPWHYAVKEGEVLLDVMGTLSRFPLSRGPAREGRVKR
jgi:hypothetical protein